jgi:predicted alpha/beta hydrolase family esterase
MTRVFVVHRWGGSPETDWYPWIKRKVEELGGECTILKMPTPQNPKMEEWIRTLAEAVGEVDVNTYLVGHSIGCQTILRYIERIPKDAEVGGVVLVAPWTRLKPESYESEEDKAVARPWIDKPIDWKKIFSHEHNTTAIFSENDPYVFVEEAEFFRKKLNADIILEKKMGHFSIYDKTTELPMLLHVLERWGIFPNRDRKRASHDISKG